MPYDFSRIGPKDGGQFRHVKAKEALATIRSVLKPTLERKLVEVKKLAKEDVVVAEVKPGHIIGGMRGIPTLIWDTSTVSTEEGIRYRDYNLIDCIATMPKRPGSHVPSAESLLWLLISGNMGTMDDVSTIQSALIPNETLDEFTEQVIHSVDGFDSDSHPMTQFIGGILCSQHRSHTQAEYHNLMKDQLWESTLIDGLEMLRRIPIIVAYIYRKLHTKDFDSNKFREDAHVICHDVDLDWAERLVRLMGLKHQWAADAIRLYVLLHADHEGGNVSAHLASTVASAHSDLFYAMSAALCGLAGPLHGLANQEALIWQRKAYDKMIKSGEFDLNKVQENDAAFVARLREIIVEDINKRKVIPGFGHAVLQIEDPRYALCRKWTSIFAPDDPYCTFNSILGKAIPGILKEVSRARCPYANVDCGSGVLLNHIGITEERFHTVLFGAARAFGIVSSLVWSRALQLPIERPKSITLTKLGQLVRKN